MSMISLRVLAFAAVPLMFACASNPTDNGPSGTGGKKGSGGSSGGSNTGGTTGSNTGGSTNSSGSGGSGSGSVDSGGTPGAACGQGRSTPTGPGIDNFDGQKQVLEWLLADMAHPQGMSTTQTGQLTVPITGPETLAVGALASWAKVDRPCMDASQYSGIQFKVSGTVKDLRLRLGTPATYPTEDGGTCAVAAMCGYSHYQKDISTMVTGTPTLVKVNFSDMTAPWGSPAAFQKSDLISVIFLSLETDTTKNFVIDDIAFF
jgi:hypothetical protein